jgi:methanogenic corrinoid protein MtbC1
MVDMDMEKFENILANYIAAKGIERTVIQIIFPFLEKIGILWQTGNINPAQEHLVSNVIRNKLIVGIESTLSHVRLNKTFLLFLPEGEHHELGLLFMWYLLKSRGARVIYLGPNVPVKDAEQVINLKKPDTIFVHLTATAPNFSFEKFLNHIQSRFNGTNTVISGLITQGYKKKIPPVVQFKRTLGEVMEYLSSL